MTIETPEAWRWPWLDPALAGILLVVLEVGVLTDSHRRGPLALNMLIVAALALAVLWRRRSPMLYLFTTGTLAGVMTAYLTPLGHSPLTAAYILLVPAYTIGAWANLRQGAARPCRPSRWRGAQRADRTTRIRSVLSSARRSQSPRRGQPAVRSAPVGSSSAS